MDSKIIKHFQNTDPVLYRLLVKVGESELKLSSRPPSQYFLSLCRNIISQQLSGKVGNIFMTRFVKLFYRQKPSPEKLLEISSAVLRHIGISNSKVAYLKNLADYFISQQDIIRSLSLLTDSEVIAELTKIKGIGRWTAEMFVMFTLARPDVFSAGDQGLKNAIKKYYPVPPNPLTWSPYRTYACLILWAGLDL